MRKFFKKTIKLTLWEFGFILLLINVYSSCVYAHPHVWVDPTIQFIFSSQKIAGVKVTYTFDEMYSLTKISQFDKNSNKTFDEKEISLLKTSILDEMDNDQYFIYLEIDDKKKSVKDPIIKSILINQDERLILEAFIPIQIPIDKQFCSIGVSIYDKNYYFEIMNPMEQTVSITGTNDIQHSLFFHEDKKNAYYYDQFYPQKVVLKYKKKVVNENY